MASTKIDDAVVEDLRRDAMRYRWLRAHMSWYRQSDEHVGVAIGPPRTVWRHDTDNVTAVTLDELCDQSMSCIV